MKTIVHEMRNQLAVAVANIEAFIDGKLEPSPRRLRAVLQALSELDVLLNDVDRLQPEPMPSRPRIVDICAVITNEVLAIEGAAAEKQVRLSVHQCPRTHAECRSFTGDPVRIGQVVKNLLLNAIRYTVPGGMVAVDCHREPESFAFSVSNDGPGIDAADLPHLFEPGYRAAATAHVAGSGMGLTIAQRIVEAHGGTVSVASRKGEGATFTVRLPDTTSTAACSACLTQVPLILTAPAVPSR